VDFQVQVKVHQDQQLNRKVWDHRVLKKRVLLQELRAWEAASASQVEQVEKQRMQPWVDLSMSLNNPKCQEVNHNLNQ